MTDLGSTSVPGCRHFIPARLRKCISPKADLAAESLSLMRELDKPQEKDPVARFRLGITHAHIINLGSGEQRRTAVAPDSDGTGLAVSTLFHAGRGLGNHSSGVMFALQNWDSCTNVMAS